MRADTLATLVGSRDVPNEARRNGGKKQRAEDHKQNSGATRHDLRQAKGVTTGHQLAYGISAYSHGNQQQFAVPEQLNQGGVLS